MTNVCANNNDERKVIEMVKRMITCQKLESSSFDYVIKQIKSHVDIPCYIIKKAYEELNPNLYDDIQVRILTFMLNNFSYYFDGDMDKRKTLKSQFNIDKDILDKAFKNVEENK